MTWSIANGGEEFLILLPEQTIETAEEAIERIRRAIEDLALPHPDNPPNDVVTINGGVAVTDRSILLGVNDWLRNADQALYRAKATGRNRVVVFDSGLEAA